MLSNFNYNNKKLLSFLTLSFFDKLEFFDKLKSFYCERLYKYIK